MHVATSIDEHVMICQSQRRGWGRAGLPIVSDQAPIPLMEMTYRVLSQLQSGLDFLCVAADEGDCR